MNKFNSQNLSRHEFLKLTGLTLLGTSVISSCNVVSNSMKADGIEITSIPIKLPNLSPSFNGYRLLQISDIHYDDQWMTRDLLAHVVEIVNQQKVDLIAITGDFITRYNSEPLEHEASYEQILVEQLSKLSAKDGVVAVLGNHDRSNESGIRWVLNNARILELRDSAYLLQRGNDMLNIAGISIEDIFNYRKHTDLVISRILGHGATILLNHYPDFADQSAATGKFDLQISGHSHGGQVNFPGVGPVILPEDGIKYPIGLYHVGNMLQYTNRGLGTLFPHVRINCAPEITVFTLSS